MREPRDGAHVHGEHEDEDPEDGFERRAPGSGTSEPSLEAGDGRAPEHDHGRVEPA